MCLRIRKPQLPVYLPNLAVRSDGHRIPFSIRIHYTILRGKNHGISAPLYRYSVKVIVRFSLLDPTKDFVDVHSAEVRGFPLSPALDGVAERRVRLQPFVKRVHCHIRQRRHAGIVRDSALRRSVCVRSPKRFQRLIEYRLRHASHAAVSQKILPAAVLLAPLHRIGNGVGHGFRQLCGGVCAGLGLAGVCAGVVLGFVVGRVLVGGA